MFQESQLSEFPTIIQDMALAHGLPIVARVDVPKFTGGLFRSGRTVANLDAVGEGPAERVSVGKSVGYPTLVFCAWLTTRLKVKQAKRPDSKAA